MKRILKISLIAGISFMVSLVILEILVRIFHPQMTYSRANEYSSDCFLKDDLLPFSLAKDRNCRIKSPEGEFDVTAHINKFGFRGEDFEKEKEKGIKRILILGDSFTFGWGVSDGWTYPSLLQKSINDGSGGNTQVINAGYADGFSPDSYSLFLKERGLSFKPDLIILQYSIINDISDLTETVWEKTDSLGLPEKISSCCRMVEGNIFRNINLEQKYQNVFLRESHLYILYTSIFRQSSGNYIDNQEKTPRREYLRGCELDPICISLLKTEEAKMQKTVKAMKDLADRNNIPFIIIMVPMETQLYPNRQAKYENYKRAPGNDIRFLQNRLGDFFSENGIEFIDLYNYFEKDKEKINPFFTFDDHFNYLGNQMIAEVLEDYIGNTDIFKVIPEK